MKFMLLIQYGDGPAPAGSEANRAAWAALSPEEQQAIGAGYGQLNQTPGVTPGSRLVPADNATTVRVEGGKAVTTDGPFVDSDKSLSGYFFLEAEDLDAAIEVAASVPHARFGAVEIRPLAD